MCPRYARLYSSVLSLLQKPANVTVESRIVNGSEFQSEGSEVAKLRVIHIAPADCAESSDRDEQLSGDVDDRHFDALWRAVVI